MQDLIIRKTSTISSGKAKFLRSYLFKDKEVYTEKLDENLNISNIEKSNDDLLRNYL